MKKVAFVLLSTLIAILAVPVKSAPAATPGSIAQKAHAFLLKQYAQQAPLADTRITIKPLPPTLEKRRCNRPVAFIHAPSKGSRLSLKAVCEQPRWTIFMSATLEQWQPVAVSGRALTKGTILGDTDIFLKPYDIRRITSPYFTNPGELIGRSLRRSVSANQVITPSLVNKQLLVRKGDLIYIEATKGPMSIRMTGTAQRDGALGEQIPVINSRSGKTIYGYVVRQGVISVSPR